MRKIALSMELSDFYEHGIARGFVRFAKTMPEWKTYGYGWMFRPLADLDGWDGDGIVARIEDEGTADRLSSLGLPIVDVAGAYSRQNFYSVTNDDGLTGYNAALHLLGCGFSRFAFLGVKDTLWSDLRREGFERGLADRGALGDRARVPAFERPLAWWEGREDDPLGQTGLEDFLSSLEPPVALFACNDTSGLRAIEVAGRIGLAVPDSLAILGVDNEDIICELASPSLSSVMLDCEAIGYRAAATLATILEGTETLERSQTAVPPREVAERESTRVFACQDELVARAVTFIRAHAHEGIDVSDIIELIPSSRRSLETRFRREMGVGIHEEIVKAKVVRAKRLLRESDDTLDHIAEESGFSALGRFHAVFRASEGLSPGEWRRKHRIW